MTGPERCDNILVKKAPEAFFKTKKMFKKIINYFKESKEELSKVVWPTRKQTLEMAIAVVIIVVVVGIYLGGVDYLLTELTALLIGS